MSFSHPWSDYNLTTAMRDPMDGRDRLTTSPLGHVLPRFSKLPNQVLAVCAVKIDHCTVRHVSTERALESRADDLVSLVVILGSLEILGRTCPREVTPLVTLFYSNFYLLWLYCQSCFTTSFFLCTGADCVLNMLPHKLLCRHCFDTVSVQLHLHCIFSAQVNPDICCNLIHVEMHSPPYLSMEKLCARIFCNIICKPFNIIFFLTVNPGAPCRT